LPLITSNNFSFNSRLIRLHGLSILLLSMRITMIIITVRASLISDIGPPLVEKSSAAAQLGRGAFSKPATLRKNHPPSYVVVFVSSSRKSCFLSCSILMRKKARFCSSGSLIFRVRNRLIFIIVLLMFHVNLTIASSGALNRFWTSSGQVRVAILPCQLWSRTKRSSSVFPFSFIWGTSLYYLSIIL